MNGNAKIPSVYLSSSLKWIVTLMFCGGTSPCDGFVRVPFVSSRQQADLYMLKNQSHSTSLPNDNDYDEFTLLSSAVSSGDWQEGAMVPWRGDAFNAQKKNGLKRRSLDLMWCGGAGQSCRQSIRERVVGDDNQFEFDGPATGQVCFTWQEEDQCILEEDVTIVPEVATASVLFLVKQHDKKLLQIAANAVQELTDSGIFVYLVPELAAKIEYTYGVRNDNVKLFEPRTSPGFGGNHVPIDDMWMAEFNQYDANAPEPLEASSPVDLICTLGGDGLLMHANVMFQGAVPPILCVAGGSLGFLTPFSRDEMVDAIRVSLGMVRRDNESPSGHLCGDEDPVGIKAYDVLRRSDDYFNSGDYGHNNGPDESSSSAADAIPKYSFGLANRICISMRMRLECKVINREGVVRARFNVLNEVTVDRGSSPYLAALECFCDNVHLTTVQADGVIFATPTGSTAYSMAAGGSVVHPAVPAILVTPICPHVLSFRSMIFPDSVVLRCYVPDDARADASVAFDGRYRRSLHRGDSVQIQMSQHPVPTINRVDHSADWLGSLKRNFNFNTRARQQPL